MTDRVSVVAALFVIGLSSGCWAAELGCDFQADQRVSVDRGWIEVEQGRDESHQLLRLAVWGPTTVAASCEQLDADVDPEVAIISRLEGTGPYYRLQIVDFDPDGIRTWSYWSAGVPKLEDHRVLLGVLPQGYQGAGSVPQYTAYRYTETGLAKEPVAP